MNKFSIELTINNLDHFYDDSKNAKYKNISLFQSSLSSPAATPLPTNHQSFSDQTGQPFLYSRNFIKISNDKSELKTGQISAHLEVCPNGFDSSNRKWLSIFVIFKSALKLKVEFEVSILNAENEPLSKLSKSGHFVLKNFSRHGWPEFVELNKLRALKELLSKNKLKILCKVEITNDLSIWRCGQMNSISNKPFATSINAACEISQWKAISKKIDIDYDKEIVIKFPNTQNDNIKFALSVYPKGHDETNNVIVFFNPFVANSNIVQPDALVYFRVSLLDSNKKKLFSKGNPVKVNCQSAQKANKIYITMISRKKLLKSSNNLLNSRIMTIYLEVLMIKCTPNSSSLPQQDDKHQSGHMNLRAIEAKGAANATENSTHIYNNNYNTNIINNSMINENSRSTIRDFKAKQN